MARRLRGEGSVYTNDKTGLHRVRVRYVDSNGKSRTKDLYGATSEEVLAKKEDFIVSVRTGKKLKNEITIKDWILKWLEECAKPTVSKSTYKIYSEKLSYVVKRMGSKLMVDVMTKDFRNLFNELKVEGGVNGNALSSSTVNIVRSVLKQCFDSAVDDGIILTNPVKKTKRIHSDKKSEMVVLDVDEMTKFIKCAYEGQYIYYGLKNPKCLNYNKGTEYLIKCYALLVDLALCTGMRIGELIGLQWLQVSYKKKYINVVKQIAANAPKDQYDDPKTANSVRQIALDDSMLEKLKSFHTYQKKYAELLGDKYIDKGLVFSNTFGAPVNYHNFYSRYFTKLVQYSGINPKFTIHSMRHTHASILLQRGVGIQVISARLGHSSPAFTLKTYIHLVNNAERTAADAWADVMSGMQNDK